MQNMQMLLASLNEAISCNASECLSWIIILFNILTVFYLAFCAWFKITKTVRLFGWIWSGVNVCVTIILIFFHTCIFTLISAVFTGLITMATLSVVFNSKNEKNELPIESDNKIKGYYVIFNTTDKKFVFRLYDKSKKYYMTSIYKYNTLENAKKAIALSRKNGIDVMLEDRTSEWIKAVNLPKFVMTGDNNKYYNEYVITENLTMLKSEIYEDIVDCSRCVHKVMNAVLTDEMYFSKENLDGKQFVQSNKDFETKNDSTEQGTDNSEIQIQQENIISSEIAPQENLKVAETKNEKVFNVNIRYAFVEELSKQSKKIQALYKEVSEYALSKPNIKEFDSKYLIKFKWGRNDLMHVKFKRGEIECLVMAGSSELKRYALLDNAMKIKEQPSKVHLTSDAALQTIKDLIDISYTNIEEARKKEN